MMRDEGKLLGGFEIEVRPQMFIGAAENPFADPYVELRAARLAKKVAAGVQFIQTQCIYNMDKFKTLMKSCVDRGLTEKCAILAGITPMKNVGMARYMQKRVPGIDVPDEIIKRMGGVPKEKQAEEGINLAVEQIEELKEDPRHRGLPHHGHRMGREGAGNRGAGRLVSPAQAQRGLRDNRPWQPEISLASSHRPQNLYLGDSRASPVRMTPGAARRANGRDLTAS